MGFNAIVYSSEVQERVVVTWYDVVDGIGIRTAADIANELIPT